MEVDPVCNLSLPPGGMGVVGRHLGDGRLLDCVHMISHTELRRDLQTKEVLRRYVAKGSIAKQDFQVSEQMTIALPGPLFRTVLLMGG